MRCLFVCLCVCERECVFSRKKGKESWVVGGRGTDVFTLAVNIKTRSSVG